MNEVIRFPGSGQPVRQNRTHDTPRQDHRDVSVMLTDPNIVHYAVLSVFDYGMTMSALPFQVPYADSSVVFANICASIGKAIPDRKRHKVSIILGPKSTLNF